MHNSKLIAMFEKLSNKELTKLGLYLKSPIFNKTDNIIKLYEIIKKEHPSCNSENLNKELVFKKLFPKKKKEDSSLRALMSQMSKIMEDFFIFLELEQNNKLKNELLLKSFMNRKLNNLFHKKIHSITKSLDKKPAQDTEYFHHVFELSNLDFQQLMYENSRPAKSGIQKVINDLDVYYIATKLRYMTAIINLQNIVRVNYELTLMEEVLDVVAHSDLQEVPFIKMYYHLCMLLKEDDEKHFEILKNLLESYGDILAGDEIRHIYTALANYCTKKIKNGKGIYLKEIFKLYKAMLNDNILMVDKYIQPYNYKNIGMAALKLKEYEWAKWFIEEYRLKVHPKYRADVYNYCIALLYFHLKDYKKAGQHLMTVELIDPYFYINYKILHIKTYYEEADYEPLKSALDALRQYIRRDKVMSNYNIESCQNFINLLNRLLRIRFGGNRPLDNLKKDLQKMPNIGERQWLFEKTEELINKKNKL
ncbi:MAG: hypothetical protein ACPG5B_15275 [Chitinophagales bacterium]